MSVDTVAVREIPIRVIATHVASVENSVHAAEAQIAIDASRLANTVPRGSGTGDFHSTILPRVAGHDARD